MSAARWFYRIGIANAACAALSIHACGNASSPTTLSSSATPSSPFLQHESGASSPIQIRTLSNRADLISGGDAYVEIVLPKPQFATALRIDVDGRDVRDAFAFRGNGRMLGVITGLANGENVVTASVGMASHAARHKITNH